MKFSFNIEMLAKVTDSVTGFEGKITGVSVYATGCRQLLVSPPIAPDGSYREGQWFDEDRIEAEGEAKAKVGYATEHKGGPQQSPRRVYPPRRSA